MIEHVPPQLYDLPLREGLVEPEPALDEGYLPLPDAQGLGVELMAGAVERFGGPR